MEKIWYLKKINIFAGLNEADLDYIDKYSGMKTYKKNDYIYFGKHNFDKIFLLKRGKVKLFKTDPSGREFVYAIIKPWEVFGNLSLSDEDDSSEFAQAMEEILVCKIEKATFRRFTEMQPKVVLQINKFLSRKIYEMEMLLEELTFHPVSQRLKSLLLKLAEKFGQDHGDGQLINLSLTHADLASMIGATRESTTKALNNLKSQGVISRQRKKIIIKKIKILKNQKV